MCVCCFGNHVLKSTKKWVSLIFSKSVGTYNNVFVYPREFVMTKNWYILAEWRSYRNDLDARNLKGDSFCIGIYVPTILTLTIMPYSVFTSWFAHIQFTSETWQAIAAGASRILCSFLWNWSSQKGRTVYCTQNTRRCFTYLALLHCTLWSRVNVFVSSKTLDTMVQPEVNLVFWQI